MLCQQIGGNSLCFPTSAKEGNNDIVFGKLHCIVTTFPIPGAQCHILASLNVLYQLFDMVTRISI